MSAARWSLRLPRTNLSRVALAKRSTTPRRITKVEQRRWIQQPPPRARPWASIPKKDDEHQQPMGSTRQDQNASERADQPSRNMQLASALATSDSSDLVTEVHIPSDLNGVLPPQHPALSILGSSSLVIQRQIEMMNVMMGFEQANRYIIMDGQGQTIGYIAEQDHGIGRALIRQMARTHRSFTTHIFDREQREVLRIHRPFSYINSRIRIYDCVPDGGYGDGVESSELQGTTVTQGVTRVSPLKLEEMRIIGEAQQQWAPLRRKYNLFSYRPLKAPQNDDTLRLESGDKQTSDSKALVTESQAPEKAIEAGMAQFAHVNEPFLSWDFTLRNEDQQTIGSVNRNFAGFAREIFTDTGVYALRMDSAAQSSALENAQGQEVARYERDATAMTLDQRAVMLATAVSIDFDYFSRHSHAGSGGFMPIFWPMGGTAAEGGAAGAGAGAAGAGAEAGAIGTAEGAGAIGSAGRGLGGAAGASEGAIAGAGTMAGYEAMQRGAQGPHGGDDASPMSNEPFPGAGGQNPEQYENRPGDEVWGEGQDPWGGQSQDPWVSGPGDSPSPPSAGGEGGGGGWLDSISDFFGD